jgi:hypothetical protein
LKLQFEKDEGRKQKFERQSEVPDARPPLADRLYVSQRIEEVILDVGSRIRDDTIRQIFSNCLPSTLGKK